MRSTKFLVLFAAFCVLSAANAFSQSIAITNARVVTVSGATIDRGTVVIRDGLIEAVGASAAVPADARVIDAAGHTVYPGFFDALTSLGLQARPAAPAGQPAAQQQAAQSNSRYPAGLRPEDAAADELRAGEAQFASARNAGFTTALSVGRTGVFNGQSAIINLAGDDVAGMVVKSPVGLHVSFSTIPGQYPGSLLGTISAIRQMFLDAKRHQELEKMYAANPRGMRRPDADASLEALIPVLDRQVPIIFNANREIEIIRAIDLAKEFNLRLIIAGGQEAGKVTDRLKAADAAVLLSLNFPKRTTASSPDADPESLEMLRFRAEVPKTAGKLAQAGVRFAFQSGGLTNLADFTANAAMSTQNGLSADAAVRAMTLSPAEIFGIADRTGSVEAGKIANITVVKGDVLSKERVVTHVFVDGKLFEPKAPPARPAGTPGTGNSAAAAGVFNVTIEVPGQPLTGSMTFVVQGQSLTGNLTTQLGSAPIRNGRVTGNRISFDATVAYGGANIDIQVVGTITGNRIEGSIDSPQGAVPFNGTRVP
ncbi:MAG: amidohydrolase family protein [Acidobacteria bacterium]|nr:amidohydrolase family protein [Acidobacteriota bacterium]